MTQIIRQALWDAELTRSGHFDKIIVQNLEVTVNAGTDVWGRKKTQRALISVTVTLDQQFASASTTDTVDGSTVHYGTLSKAIQAQLQQNASSSWISTAELSTTVADSVRKVADSTPIYAVETNVCYLKGSMFGDGAGYVTSSIEPSGQRSNVLYLRNVRIPCLIGVNSNERLQKQPVVLNIWIECVNEVRADDYAKLETLLFTVCLCYNVLKVEIDTLQQISASEFQTLESMLEWAAQLLRQQFFTSEDNDAWIRLRIEKPLAVPFADAPAVEIMRLVKSS
jgi:dihydroneopterin aldolase